jgi:hypothetical protein
MSGKDITIGELKEWRKKVLEAYNTGSNSIETAFEAKKISRGQMLDGVGELQRLKLQAVKILALIGSRELDELLATDSNSPATRIGQSVDRLNAAAARIDNFLNFLESIADVLRIAGGVVTALQTGVIARIK